MFGEAVADFNGSAGFDFVALLGELGFDAVDVVAHIDLVDHRVLMGIFRHQVLVEETDRLFGGCGGQPNEEGIEVFEHLAPEVVDGAVAFVDDDDIELFDGDVGVVADGPGLFVEGAAFYFKAGVFVGFIIQLLMGKLRIQALDGGDGDLGGVGDAGAAEDVDVVVLGEFAAIVGDDELFKFILGIGGEVATVDQEQDAFDLGELGQAIDLRDGGVGFAGAGGHLQQGAGFGGLEGLFDAVNGVDLAGPQVFGIQCRELLHSGAQGLPLLQPGLEGFRFVEMEDVAGTGMWIALVPEPDLVVGGLEQERQGLAIGHPALDVFALGGGITGRLFGNTAQLSALALGLDNAAGTAIDEQHVIRRAGVGVHFTDGDPQRLIEVELLPVLNGPACRCELLINLFAGDSFEFC